MLRGRGGRTGERALRLLGRAARAVAIAALAVWALWIVAAQALLWTPLLRHLINAEKPSIYVEYRLAWSLWPGAVHVRDIVLTSQDRAVQWRLALDRASVAVSFWQLPSRLFHVTSVRVHGVQFALRRRIPKSELAPERLEGLPPIPGFDPVPVADEGPEDEIPDSRYRLFSVWLQEIDAREVREVWIDRLRFEGPASVSGSFYLKPIRRLLVAPGDIHLDGASIRYSSDRVATDLRGRMSVRLAPLDPRGLTFATFARDLDIDADLTAKLSGLEVLSRAAGAKVRGGAGRVRLAVRLQAGQVLPGTSATAELGEASVHVRGVAIRIPRTAVAFEIPARPPPHAARASLHAKDVRIADAATVGGTRLAVEGPAPDLADLRPPRTARVEIQDGRIQDVKAAAALAHLPASVRVDEGTGQFAIEMAGPLDQLRGSARLGLSSLKLEADGVRVRATLGIDASVAAFDPRRGGDLRGTRIDVEDARVINPGGEEDTAPGWWAHLTLPRAAFRTRQRVVDADLEGRCRDARPLVGLFVRREQLPDLLAGLFAMDNLQVRGSALAGPGFVAVRDLTADGEGASVRLAYRADRSGKRGAALLTAHGITVGLSLGDGGTQVHLGAASDWFAEAQARLQPDRAVRPLARTRRAPHRRGAPPVQAAE